MRPVLVFLLIAAAGCVSPAASPDAVARPPVVPSFAQSHDHFDPAAHHEAMGLRLRSFHTLAPDNGTRGEWLTGEIVVRGTHAYVVYVGAQWILAIVDVSDPQRPVLVGQLETTNAWGMDVAASEDGDWVFVATYPSAVGELFERGYAVDTLAAPAGAGAPGVAVVDARDRSAPRVASFFPIHGLGPHTVGYHAHEDGKEYVFAQKADLQLGNMVYITQLVDLPTGDKALRPVSTWSNGGPPVQPHQPHDLDVQKHPIDGRTLMYVAYTWDGLYVVDVTDPARPAVVSHVEVGSVNDPDALMHDVHPYPHVVDGRHFTLAAPEIVGGDTTGSIRVFDTTDPAAPEQVGTWTLPGAYVSDEPFSFTMHNFVFLHDGSVALAHGHAGVWVLDWLSSRGTDIAPRGYFAASVAAAPPPSWDPTTGAPWFWGTAVDEAGNLWASDSTAGLVGLALG